MSITDELRDWFKDRMFMGNGWQEIHAIADRIDADHEKALDERDSERFNALMDARDRGVNAVLKEPGGFGLVELPKDADGEYIHVGDVMDSRVDYLFDGKPFTVRALVLCEDGWEVADGRFGNRYEPDSLRHRHAPTVEDVLREFANEVYADADNEIRDRDFLCAKYAKRLTLAEGEDA